MKDNRDVVSIAFLPMHSAAIRTLQKFLCDGAGEEKTYGGDRPGNVPLHRCRCRAAGSLRVGQALCVERSSFRAGRR